MQARGDAGGRMGSTGPDNSMASTSMEMEDDDSDMSIVPARTPNLAQSELPRPRSLAPQSPTVSQDSWLVAPPAAAPAQPAPTASFLPHEILLHVFRFVAARPTDLRSCLAVCKTWTLCGVELLWHRPAFKNLEGFQKFAKVLASPTATFEYASFVRRINFVAIAGHLTDDTFRSIAACTRVERLTLSDCKHLSNKVLEEVLTQTKNIVAIDLTGVTGLEDGALKILAATCPRLQGINLSGCQQLSSEAVANLARAAPLLRRVKLCECVGVGDEALIALAQNCSVLLEVDLVGCSKLSDLSARQIWSRAFHLRELRMAQCINLTDLAFPAPASHLSKAQAAAARHHRSHGVGGIESAPASRGASPTGTRSTGQNGSDGSTAPPNGHDSIGLPRTATMPDHQAPLTSLAPPRIFEQLRILDLTNCNAISDAAVEGIITHAPRIRNLILAKCTRLTDACIYSISQLGRNLHLLHLGHVSNITDRAVIHLAKTCTRLRYIDLACCPQLTDESIIEMASSLPKLRRIGLVRVTNLTDQAIYQLVDRYTSLERVHLSYCENISVPAIFYLLQRLGGLTHLSLTGVPAFRKPELQAYCRSPPKDFNDHQRSAFCVYSGRGVNELRRYLSGVYLEKPERHDFGELTPEVQRALASLSAAQHPLLRSYEAAGFAVDHAANFRAPWPQGSLHEQGASSQGSRFELGPPLPRAVAQEWGARLGRPARDPVNADTAATRAERHHFDYRNPTPSYANHAHTSSVPGSFYFSDHVYNQERGQAPTAGQPAAGASSSTQTEWSPWNPRVDAAQPSPGHSTAEYGTNRTPRQQQHLAALETPPIEMRSANEPTESSASSRARNGQPQRSAELQQAIDRLRAMSSRPP
ncbi:Leucine rich repeat proteins, some proteins contain F-box [Ceraceosorus bombacis]|uniref:Leucine rich repeat proteins, some proteins contain F-box n=1 Tax=Ceraceosorus bombacis TaxID=401625 RepID=A0A0P1BAR6_9BASI|nr:Leucine rich repeat proteins, some proteins contain F-box [Ceraceosorus bombacis]